MSSNNRTNGTVDKDMVEILSELKHISRKIEEFNENMKKIDDLNDRVIRLETKVDSDKPSPWDGKIKITTFGTIVGAIIVTLYEVLKFFL